jgi:hypothetical protein
MSMGWWAQRLDSVYLYHDGEYKQVDDVVIDNKRWELVKGEQAGRNPYPEMYESSLDVVFDDSTVPYSECEIRWPVEGYGQPTEDQYATWHGRNMRRVFVLGPTSGAYDVGGRGREPFSEWVNAPEPEHYTMKEVLEWGKRDVLLDKKTVATAVRNNSITIKHCDVQVMSLCRDRGRVVGEWSLARPPQYLEDFLRCYIGSRPYMGPEYADVADADAEVNLNYTWRKVKEGMLHAEWCYEITDGMMYVTQGGNHRRPMHNYAHLAHFFHDVDVQEDLLMLAEGLDFPENLTEEDDDEY